MDEERFYDMSRDPDGVEHLTDRIGHLKDRIEGRGQDHAWQWYLLGFRLLPIVPFISLWPVMDGWLDKFGYWGNYFATWGIVLLAAGASALIHLFFHVPRYGWPGPANNGFWNQVKSLPSFTLVFLVFIFLPLAGILLDIVFALPVSFTLMSWGVLLFGWWWLSGKKGRLFEIEDNWRWPTMGHPLSSKLWELCCRHYCLILAGSVFALGLTPLSGLVSPQAFLNAWFLSLLLVFSLIVCMVFDELRLRRLSNLFKALSLSRVGP